MAGVLFALYAIIEVLHLLTVFVIFVGVNIAYISIALLAVIFLLSVLSLNNKKAMKHIIFLGVEFLAGIILISVLPGYLATMTPHGYQATILVGLTYNGVDSASVMSISSTPLSGNFISPLSFLFLNPVLEAQAYCPTLVSATAEQISSQISQAEITVPGLQKGSTCYFKVYEYGVGGPVNTQEVLIG